jgi:hypothetical protein
MVGGTSTTCKYNLINPLDTNGAFRLNFVNAWAFASTGITGNGTSTYADTFLAPNSHLSLNNTQISIYSRTNSNNPGQVDMGLTDTTNSLFLAPRYDGGSSFYSANNSSQLGPTTSPLVIGFFQSSRIVNTQFVEYLNGSIFNTRIQASGGLSTKNIWIGAHNSGTPFSTNREYAFASIGEGMTDGEASTFYTIVQTFQTTLGRQV